jgi:hypothetical protein
VFICVHLWVLISCATRPAFNSIEIDDAFAWNEIAPGLEILEGRTANPRLEFWAVRADLSKAALKMVPGTFSATKVSAFARETESLAAINANPFDRTDAQEGEPLVPVGIVIAEGVVLSPPNPRYDALVFFDNGTASIVNQSFFLESAAISNNESGPWSPVPGPQSSVPSSPVSGPCYALGGFYQILKDGEPTAQALSERGNVRHPRSAAGVGEGGGILYLLLIDGRRTGSVGATEAETALLLARLGAHDGLCFDGGGSSALAVRIDGEVKIVNRPGGILNRERAVAVCLGLVRTEDE